MHPRNDRKSLDQSLKKLRKFMTLTSNGWGKPGFPSFPCFLGTQIRGSPVPAVVPFKSWDDLQLLDALLCYNYFAGMFIRIPHAFVRNFQQSRQKKTNFMVFKCLKPPFPYFSKAIWRFPEMRVPLVIIHF